MLGQYRPIRGLYDTVLTNERPALMSPSPGAAFRQSASEVRIINCILDKVVTITVSRSALSPHNQIFGSVRSSRNANLRSFVCLMKSVLGSRARNIHLSLSGQAQVSLRSFLNLSKAKVSLSSLLTSSDRRSLNYFTLFPQKYQTLLRSNSVLNCVLDIRRVITTFFLLFLSDNFS